LKIWSKDGGSPVTDADLAVDALLKTAWRRASRLRLAVGGDGRRSGPPDHPRQFVVDPIDGTAAFMKGKPWFAVSIAVVENGQPDRRRRPRPGPERDLRRHADGPATLNGAPIAPAPPTVWKARPCSATPRCSSIRPGASRGRPMRIESRNSIAYRMCLVAAGRLRRRHRPVAQERVGPGRRRPDLPPRPAPGSATTKAAISPIIAPFRCFRAWFAPIGRLHPLILSRVGHIDLP
jgi:myo-inositol-1(or 4)-monophosphatase